MLIDYRTTRKFNKPKSVATVVRDFSKLQNTELDQDKIPFEVFHEAKNVIHKGLDADVRKGVTKLGTVASILGIGFHKVDSATNMLGVVKTTTTSKVVSISRTDGSTADITTGVVGTSAPNFNSLRQTAYIANSEADIELVSSIGATGTPIAMPSSAIAKFATNDTERLWVAQTNGLLRASTISEGEVASAHFTVSGTAISRAVLAQTQIVNFKSLKSNGKLVCAAGDDSIELHRTPNFATNGITTYPADVPTLVQSYINIGVSNNDAIIPYDSGFFVKPKDGVLYFIAEALDKPQEFRIDLQEMEKMDWSNCVMGIDLKKKLLFITGKFNASYDRTIVFNIQEQNFSYYDNIWSRQWISDAANIYYLNSFNFDIQDAFQDSYVTDNGVKIDWEIETASVYGNLENYWKSTLFFMNVLYGGDIDVTASLVVDGRVGGTKAPSWTKTFELKDTSTAFTGGIAGFGSGIFSGIEAGLAMYHKDSELYTETYNYNEKVLTTFKRGFLRLAGSSRNLFSIRGIGMNSVPTSRQVRDVTMSN